MTNRIDKRMKQDRTNSAEPPRARSLLALLLGTAASVGGCGESYEGYLVEPHLEQRSFAIGETEDGEPVPPPTQTTCRTVTVSGDVFYNDLRDSGRFAMRSSPSGTPGTRDRYGSGDNQNYLGMLDATVEIYEVDRNSLPNGGCVPSDLQGSARVTADGSFSWRGEICDHCEQDFEGGANDRDFSIAAKIVLRQCDNDRCFRVASPSAYAATHHFDDDYSGATRFRWFRNATTTSPRMLSGGSVDIGTDYYQASSSMTAGVPTDVDAQAANVFASAVDVTRKVHTELDVPFDEPEVSVYYPEPAGTHSHEGGFVCVKSPGSTAWVTGKEAAHEYGHLLHYAEWNHHGKWVSYCYDSNGNGDVSDEECEESYDQKEYVNAALKEGWADFIAHVTFNGTGSPLGCNQIENVAATGCVRGQACAVSRHFFEDVSRALCDLWDSSTPDTEDINGGNIVTDLSTISLPTLVAGLRSMWLDASADQRESYEESSVDRDTTAALGICELAEALVSSQITSTSLDATFNVSNLECGNL